MTLTDVSGGVLGRPLVQGGAPRIAVFRALNLGDMLCALPALRALRQAQPDAHITLIGLESARPLLERFPDYIDELVLFPGDPAFPEQAVRHDALPEFFRQMRARNFDLVLQMHGSGQQSNRIVEDLAPRQWAGFVPSTEPGEEGRLFPWPDELHEVHRYLALLQFLGVEAANDELEFRVSGEEAQQAVSLAQQHGIELERSVLIHAGARLASRRWPPERFAAVAIMLQQEGWQIALTGSAAEADVVGRIQELSSEHGRVVNLCGQTNLGVLAALLQRARLLICNDTGVSHVAAALRTPSVVVASGSDVRRWAPLDSTRHIVLHADTDCRPCVYDACPVGHVCALGVEVEQVVEQARKQLMLRL